MRLIKLLCKLFKISVFEISTQSTVLVSKHAIIRSRERIKYQTLLEMATELALEKGSKAVHFEYYNNQKDEYAKLYNGYIWVFGGNGTLITVYPVSKMVDLLVTRK